ncbi:MAG: cytochrome C biogenesis protein CcmC [Armatimonadetes bacterium]|nr:cytochrome C biogenesis protein CcmC [Armatimonadota bacterium]
MLLSLWMVFLYAPTERIMGQVQRIFYFHVSLSFVSFLAFAVVFLGSLQYLRTGREFWDELAAASAEIGVLFNGLVIVTGSIWARPTWGVWWTWDPQLTATLIMQLMYMAYMALRASAEGERQARLAAVLGIVSLVNVPLVFFSARLLRGISPVIFTRRGRGLEPAMLETFLVSLVTMLVLYFVLTRVRLRLGLAAAAVARLRAETLA